jgi:hypothetical protein
MEKSMIAYNLIQHSRYYDILEEKFHLFLDFSKEIEIKYPTEDIDREFYKILYEGGVISKEEMLSYIDKKPKRDITIDTDNTIYFHEKPTDYELLSKLAKVYFGVSESDWKYVEPMFRAILDKGLDLDEDNIYVYTMMLIDISIDPEEAGKDIVNKLKTLDEFRDIEGIKDVIGKKLEWEELAKALIDFLIDHVEKAIEDDRSLEILKAVLKL